MKRFLINISVFFVIVTICDFCFGYVCDYMQRHPKGGGTKLFNDLMINDCHEVLVMGSSRAYHHYDPDMLEDQLGLESYNAGFNGNGVVLAYPILSNILDRCKPQLVIFEVTSSFDIVKNSNDDNNLRYLARLKPYFEIPVVRDVVRSVSKESYIQFHSGLFRHNSEFCTVAMDYLKPRPMDYKGFGPLQGEYQGSFSAPSPIEMEYDTLKIHYLQQLAKLKQERNVNMVWVMSPIFESYDQSYETYVIAKDIADQFEIPVLDHFYDTMFVGHSEFFKDAGHLNANGASLFTKMLSSEMEPFLCN